MSSDIFEDAEFDDDNKYGSEFYYSNTDYQNFLRASVHLRFKEKDEALNLHNLLYERGVEAYKKDNQRALYIFNELIKQKAQCVELSYLYFAKGKVYFDLEDYPQTISSLNQVIKIDPKFNSNKLFYLKGISYFKLNQNARALEHLEKVKFQQDEIEDKNNFFLLRGNLYLQANKLDEALQDFNEGVELFPDLSECWYKRGKVFELMEYYQRSIEDYKKAISLAPQDPLSSATLGQLFFLLKDHKQAQIYLEMAEKNLLNLTSSGLTMLNLTQENVKYIKQKIKLLQSINTGLNQIKEEMYLLTKKTILQSQQSQEYTQQVTQCELRLKNSLKNSSFEGTPSSSSDILHFCQKISQEIQQLSQKLIMLEQKQGNMEFQIQILMQQEPFVIQQELEELLKSENQEKYLYYRSVFWRLYNYLQAMSLISTNLIQFNSDALIENNSEKLLNILQNIVNVSSTIAGFVPIVGSAFNIINSALDFGIESMKDRKFKNRMMNLTSILQRFTITPSELEREIQFASIYLAKSLQREPQIDQQSKYYSFIQELSKQEEKYEKNTESPYWKKGVEHSFIILKYLEDNCQNLLQTQQKMNLRIIIVEAISISDWQMKIQSNIKFQRDPKGEKQKCCKIQ